MPLHVACRFGHTRAAHFMLENGAQINAKASPGIAECPDATPLHFAVYSGMPATVQLLVSPPWSAYVDPNVADAHGQTAIFKSLYHANIQSESSSRKLSPDQDSRDLGVRELNCCLYLVSSYIGFSLTIPLPSRCLAGGATHRKSASYLGRAQPTPGYGLALGKPESRDCDDAGKTPL
jgi:hypothetical protein